MCLSLCVFEFIFLPVSFARSRTHSAMSMRSFCFSISLSLQCFSFLNVLRLQCLCWHTSLGASTWLPVVTSLMRRLTPSETHLHPWADGGCASQAPASKATNYLARCPHLPRGVPKPPLPPLRSAAAPARWVCSAIKAPHLCGQCLVSPASLRRNSFFSQNFYIFFAVHVAGCNFFNLTTWVYFNVCSIPLPLSSVLPLILLGTVPPH
jgi:hypothetical protein